MKNLSSLLIILCLSISVNGQQLNQYSLFAYNLYKDHNSYAGFDQKMVLSAHLRNQWVNHPGSPSVQYLGVQMPIFSIKAGMGLDFENVAEGSFTYRRARASINKAFSFGEMLCSAGVRLSFNQLVIDGSALLTPEGEYLDGLINHNDQILGNQIAKGYGLGYDISFFARWRNFQGGVSISDIPGRKVNAEVFSFAFKEHLNVFFSGFFLVADNIQFQPSMMVRTDFNVIQTDISGVFNVNGNIFGGIGLRGYHSRSLDALGFMFGHKINRKYSVYYNYDLPVSSLKRTNEGSHELLLKMSLESLFGRPNKPKIIYNPRFLK